MQEYYYDKEKNPEYEIIWASFWGNKILIKDLIKRGVNINIKDKQGNFALQLACYQNNLSVVYLLVENGADINQTDWWDRSPLMMAASQGYIDIVRFLLDCGANTKLIDRKGFDAKRIAKYFKHFGTAKLIGPSA